MRREKKKRKKVIKGKQRRANRERASLKLLRLSVLSRVSL